MSIKSVVLKSLKSGKVFSVKQLASACGTTEASIRARVSELRADGYFGIRTTTTKTGKTAYAMSK